MGNTLYGFCGGEATRNGERKNECVFNKGKLEDLTNNPDAVKSALTIQKKYLKYKTMSELKADEENLMKEFDENIVLHGRFITEEEMYQAISDNVRKIENLLGPNKVTDEEINKFKHAFKRGPILFHDGTIYSGQWNYLGKKQGYGVYIKADGSMYQGFWFNDKIEGKGRFIDKNGSHYEGQWKNGLANGKGVLLVVQGSKYEGDWVDDIQEGYGEERFPDKTYYKGQYKNGHKHGKGRFTWNDDSYYEGDFFNSSITGKGVLHWKDGREYTGDWLNNKMHGSGVFTWPDGKKYVGEYRNDKKEGFGIYYWSQDKYYEGEWLNSKQHGEGKFVLKGRPLRGQFRFGRLIQRYDDDNKENLTANVDKSEINLKDNSQIIRNEDIDPNLQVEDKKHHIEKMNIGQTSSPNLI